MEPMFLDIRESKKMLCTAFLSWNSSFVMITVKMNPKSILYGDDFKRSSKYGTITKYPRRL